MMARAPSEIANDGFGLPEATRNLKGFAVLSLRIAMRAYFATYRAMLHFHAFYDPNYKAGEDTDYLHATNYYSF